MWMWHVNLVHVQLMGRVQRQVRAWVDPNPRTGTGQQQNLLRARADGHRQEFTRGVVQTHTHSLGH